MMVLEKIINFSQSPTDPQRAAIIHEGSPLLIIAGPGSGKTKVISWRVTYLIKSGRVNPENLLVLTFTRKAALELKDRIQNDLPEINAELMQISTFHSFCADLLRHYGRSSGLLPVFNILDESGQFLLVYGHRKELGLDAILKGFPNGFYHSVIAVFDHATEEQVEVNQLVDWIKENLSCCNEKESQLWQERQVVADAYGKYCQLLQQEGLLDFAHLQDYALRLLKQNPDLLKVLQSQYKEILVDEYQDTNIIQELILAQLAGDGRHLTVVGDDDQSIYRFRGATVRNILEFDKRYPEAKTENLVHNFRSRTQIVDHSLQVITHNPARYEKKLEPMRGLGSEVMLVYENNAVEEANAVVQMLLNLRKAGKIIRWQDVAILLRSVKSYAEPYCDALAASGIPFQVIGDASFFDREEVSQLYNLISFLSATKSWGDRHLRQTLVGLNPETCEVLKTYKENLSDISTPEELIEIGITNKKDLQKLLAILQLKRRVQSKQHTSLLEIFYDLLAITGCFGRFEQDGQTEALANLGIFSQLVADWDENGTSNNFYPFQEYLKLIKDVGIDPFLPEVEDSVHIMTIHQSKGLEFPVVVLGAAMDGRLPANRRQNAYEIPPRFCASGEPEVADPHLVDERKLFYVAATRARDLLIVGTANVVNKRGGGPSPFLFEMFGSDLHKAAQLSLEKVHGIESQDKVFHQSRPRHSFSELAMFLDCPISYKFAYVYGFEICTYQMILFGANIHLALEKIHQECKNGHIPGENDIPEIVAQTWVKAPQASQPKEKEMKLLAIHYLQDYVSNFHVDLARVVQSEFPFSFDLNGHVLQGQIDLLRRNEDGDLEIVDFKTSQPRPEEMERDAFQLGLYSLGATESLNVPVSDLTVHFIDKKQKVVKIPWDENRREQVQERLTEILNSIEQEEFKPNHKFCRFCQEFSMICPYVAKNL